MAIFRWFNDILRDYLRENFISINEYSKDIKISYVSLHRMLHGGQNIGEKDFQKMMGSSYVKASDEAYLTHAFEERNIDKDDGQRVKCVFNILESLNQLEQYSDQDLNICENMDFENMDQLAALDSSEQIVNRLALRLYEICKERKNDTENIFSEKAKIRIFIPSEEKLIAGIFDVLKGLSKKENASEMFDIEVLLLLGSGAKSKNNLHSLVNLSKFISFITLDSFIKIKYIEDPGAESFSSIHPMPYYIVVNDRTLMINKEANVGIDVCNCGQAKPVGPIFSENYNKIENVKLLVKSYKATDLNDYIYALTQNDLYMKSNNYTLRYEFSSVSISNEMYVKRIKDTFLKLKLKNFSTIDLSSLRKFSARMKAESEKITLQNVDMCQFLLEDGIDHFLRESYLGDFLEIGGRFSEYEKLQLVLETLKKVQKGYKLRILSKATISEFKFLGLIRKFEFYYESGELMIARHMLIEEATLPPKGTIKLGGKSINYAVVINNEEITRAFEVFYKGFLKINSYSESESFELIKGKTRKHYGENKDSSLNVILNEIKAIELKK